MQIRSDANGTFLMPLNSVRYSKPISAVGGIVATIMACGGAAGVLILLIMAPQAWPFMLVLGVWTLAAGSIAAFHWINVFSRSGIPIVEIDSTVCDVSESAEARLKTLEDLKNRNLISIKEYEAQRTEIIRSI